MHCFALLNLKVTVEALPVHSIGLPEENVNPSDEPTLNRVEIQSDNPKETLNLAEVQSDNVKETPDTSDQQTNELPIRGESEENLVKVNS